eukprot:TRINITY_DN1377_c0_g1_i1.p2 TRINITY_DN1377_c0_g1~~TRINITY_DN1377_c0_g1_i1.p2  ORF type:complete len:272 (-),score=76.86 TRINITY_DN1377_c0_g1_i1:1329-2144(-)
MATEYYQIPSQQGTMLPLPSPPSVSSEVDPWLIAATNALSLADWTPSSKRSASPPSLFEDDETQALTWAQPAPQPSSVTFESKMPNAPKQFLSTASHVDPWSVVDNSVMLAMQKKQHQKIVAVVEPPKASIEEELAHQNRYKTELCKSFTETGVCRYGVKCQFAHGKEEVRPILRHPKYKTEICKTFHNTGTCPYGMRCRFIHTRSKEDVASYGASMMVSHVSLADPSDLDEDFDNDVASYGMSMHPAGQWSSSWTVMSQPSFMKSGPIGF